MREVTLRECLNAMPLIAVLRGTEPNQAYNVGEVLVESGIKIIEVTIPLRRMFGFTTVLRSLTKGRGTFVMTFFNFSPCDLSP